MAVLRIDMVYHTSEEANAMNIFNIPERRTLTFGTLTLQSLPKRFIDATREFDPYLEEEDCHEVWAS